MDRRHRYLAILAQSDHAVQQAAGQAFRRLLELIRQGNAPRTAIDQILREFNADTVSGFREAFSAVLESSLGEKTLKAWPVGGVKLSQRLYQNAQQVSATTKTIIEQHLKGLHNAQELRKALYEGYHFQQERIQYVQIRLSSKHPKTDICDYHAKVDLYGLGPGVYPKAEAPKPPFHPYCGCRVVPCLSVRPKKPPKFNPNAERTFLATLPAKEAAQVAGSFEKRRRILEDNASLEDLYNAGKDELYQWKRVGDFGQDTRMKTELRHLVSGEVFDDARAILQARTLPPDIVNAGLTDAEQVALHLWTRDTGQDAWFQQINRALRSGNEDDLKRLQPLIEAMRNGLEKLPRFEGTVYRGIKERGFQGDFPQWVERLQPKEMIEDLGFAGSSVDPEQKLRGRVKWIIRSKAGKDISALSNKPEQTEVLFGDGSKFMIDRVNIKQNGVIEIWATQIDNLPNRFLK